MTLPTKILFAFIFTFICQSGFSQDFFKDYTSYLESCNKRSDWTKKKKHQFAFQFSKNLQRLFKNVSAKEHLSMLRDGVIYFIRYDGQDNTDSILVWNNRHSCFCEYSVRYNFTNRIIKYTPIKLATNSAARLNKLDPQLKAIVEKCDTLNYKTYMLLNTTIVGKSFTVAIKTNHHWHFIYSKEYIDIIDGKLNFHNLFMKKLYDRT